MTRDRRKAFEEIFQGRIPFDVIDECLNRDPCAFETGFAAHSLRIDPNDLVELGSLFNGHAFNLREIPGAMQTGQCLVLEELRLKARNFAPESLGDTPEELLDIHRTVIFSSTCERWGDRQRLIMIFEPHQEGSLICAR